MKNNLKSVDLLKKGISSKVLIKLTESQLDTLHKKLMGEQTQPNITKTTQTVTSYKVPANQEAEITTGGKNVVVKNKGGITTVTPMEGEMKEKEETKNNPWAICHAQLGPKKTRKFERCVRDVKKSLKEGKNPLSLFLENKIMEMVEKHIPPRITKGDLIDYLLEDTKTKPKTKPDTKTPPKEKPHDPFKPSPHKQPAPKAKKETKEAVMDAPAKPKEAPTKPGTKTPPKPRPHDPFRPDPSKQPAPKAKTKMPEWLKFGSMGIKLK